MTSVRFGLATADLQGSTDSEFLTSVKWRNALPGLNGSDSSEPGLRTIGMCWKQQCQNRSLPKLKSRSLTFATLDRQIQTSEDGSLFRILELVRQITGPLKSAARASRTTKKSDGRSEALLANLELWLTTQSPLAETDPQTLLACCELLLVHAEKLPAEMLGRLWRVTLSGAIAQADSFTVAGDGAEWDLIIGSGEGDELDNQWLCSALLPWVCGALFDDVKGAPSVAKLGRSTLNAQFLQVTDAVGIPVAAVIDDLQTHLSHWSDALLVAEIFERPLWKGTSETRFGLFLKHAAALVQSDGGFSGSDYEDVRAASLVLSAAELSGVESGTRWLRCVAAVQKSLEARPGSKKASPSKSGTSSKTSKVHKKDIPSWQSDEAEFACLRTAWSPDATIATLNYADDDVSLSFLLEGMPLFEGLWEIEVEEDGQLIEMAPNWECVCWYTVEEVDYCELQLEFEGGPKIDRFLVLSRTEQFAIFSDVITEAGGQRVDVRNRLPLCPDVKYSVVEGTRERTLSVGGHRVRVCPVALPYDAGHGTAGRIDVETDDDGDSTLVIGTASSTGNLFSPVLLDWSPTRRKSQVEWTPLTVTEAGEITRDGASAFRIRTGPLNLVLFRAFRRTDRYRTVLGYLTESETVIAEFTQKGELSELVMVEQ